MSRNNKFYFKFLFRNSRVFPHASLVSSSNPGAQRLEAACIIAQFGEYEAAEELYEEIIQENTNPEIKKVAWNNLGVIHLNLGQPLNFKKAKECFLKAKEFDSKMGQAWANLIRACHYSKEKENVDLYFEQADSAGVSTEVLDILREELI